MIGPFLRDHDIAHLQRRIDAARLYRLGAVPLATYFGLQIDYLDAMDALLDTERETLEDGEVSISRSAGKITLPCSMMLVAAMNPCKCGYLGDARHEYRCSPTEIQRYRARISGPLLDRIDLHIEAPALALTELRSEKLGEPSSAMRTRIQSSSTV